MQEKESELEEVKGAYAAKNTEMEDIEADLKRRLHERNSELVELREQIVEPIENIDAVFSII